MPVYMPDISQYQSAKTLNVIAYRAIARRELWSSAQRREFGRRQLCCLTEYLSESSWGKQGQRGSEL